MLVSEAAAPDVVPELPLVVVVVPEASVEESELLLMICENIWKAA